MFDFIKAAWLYILKWDGIIFIVIIGLILAIFLCSWIKGLVNIIKDKIEYKDETK